MHLTLQLLRILLGRWHQQVEHPRCAVLGPSKVMLLLVSPTMKLANVSMRKKPVGRLVGNMCVSFIHQPKVEILKILAI